MYVSDAMYRQIQEWLDRSVQEAEAVGSMIDRTCKDLTVRRIRKSYRVGGNHNFSLEWWEFADNEAKSLYWSEILRIEAWQTLLKEK